MPWFTPWHNRIYPSMHVYSCFIDEEDTAAKARVLHTLFFLISDAFTQKRPNDFPEMWTFYKVQIYFFQTSSADFPVLRNLK